MPAKPITATPESGGRLITRRTHAAGGFENYSIKRDWRRDMGDEIRAEGHIYFRPNLNADLGTQPDPTNQEYRISGFENGGFENDDDGSGVPDGWAATLSGTTLSLDSAVVLNDIRSAKFTNTLAADSGYIQTSAFLPIGEDRLWKLTLNAIVETAGHLIKVEVYWYDSDQVALATNPSTEIFGGAGQTIWTEYIMTITPPTDASYGKLRLTGKVAGDTNLGAAWFDDVDLVEKDREVIPLNLLTQYRMPNGKLITFAGTAEKLYKFEFDGDEPYFGQSGVGYYFEDDYVVEDYTADNTEGDYVDDDYIQGAQGFWQIIGSGFSRNGQRWEAEPVGPGYIVFNNGVDLPVYYRYPDSEVTPLYEMRESGVVKAGSIAEYQNALHADDISQLKSDKYATVFDHDRPPTALKCKQYGSRKSHPHTATSEYGNAVDLGDSESGSYVSVPDSTDIEPAIDFTFEAIVKFDPTPSVGDFYGIFSKSASYIFGAVSSDGINMAMQLNVWNSATPITITSDYTFPVTHSPWVHLAVTVTDGSEVRFFFNGALVDTRITSFNSPDTNSNIGQFGAGTFLGGMKIAEFRIWSDVRTPDEIADNAYSDVTGSSNLAAYWKFDDGSGVTATDDSGNGNDGTLTAGAVFIDSDAPCDSYILMSDIDADVNGLTNNGGGVATFISSTAHGLTTGDKVTISGSSTSDYNVSDATATVVDLFTFTYPMAVIGAGTSGGSPVFQRAFFETGHIGKRLLFSNGLSVTVNKRESGVKAKVSGRVSSLNGEDRVFRVISESDEALTGTVTKAASSATVNGVGTSFTTELSIGQLIRIGSIEEVRKVVSISNDTTLTVDSNFDENEGGVTAYRVTDYTVLCSGSHFDSGMVGKHVLFDDGQARKITAYNNSKRVEVDDYREVNEQTFAIENTSAYDAITNGTLYERVRYRTLWSALDQPYTFESSPAGSISVGSIRLELQYQTRSFEPGMQITISGAGPSGANLTTTIRRILQNKTTILLTDTASTTVEDAEVQRTDSIGSIVGYADLSDESGALIKSKKLAGVLIKYKERSAYFCQYTGDVDNPFVFRERYRGSKTPFFRYTLTNVTINGSEYHLYRGRNSFYAFDLVRQIPVEIAELEDVENLMTDGDLSDINLVFAFDNPITKEWFVCYPTAASDKAICFDYMFRTVRTTSAEFTAGAAIERMTGNDNEFSHNWVIVATPDSKVSVYGKTDQPDPLIGDRDAVYNRNGADYASVLRSSMWGNRSGEVNLSGYVPELSSHTPDAVNPVTFRLYGINNPPSSTLLVEEDIELPADEPGLQLHFEKMLFQDELVASGDGATRLSARTIYADGLNTHSHARRER